MKIQKIKILFLTLLFVSQIVYGKTYGLYYMSNYPTIQDQGNTIVMSGNNRVTFLQTKSTQSPKKADFAFFDLTGKTVEFDLDISTATCGCNFGIYTVDLHAATDSHLYCDANKIEGTWCPENDIMEANRQGIHVTPHCCCQQGCNGTPGDLCLTQIQDQYIQCDQWGYSGGYGNKNLKLNIFQGGIHIENFDHVDAYGPGKYIDTTQPYHFKQQYKENEIVTELSQQGKHINLHHNKYQQYIQKFKPFIANGMSLVITLWGGDMNWLDGGEGGCKNEQCSLTEVFVKLSNLKINDELITFEQKQEEKLQSF